MILSEIFNTVECPAMIAWHMTNCTNTFLLPDSPGERVPSFKCMNCAVNIDNGILFNAYCYFYKMNERFSR